MKKIYKEVKSICGGTFVYQVCVPSSKRDGKVLKTKYSHMDNYGVIQLGKCNEREKKLIVAAFVLHHLDGEVLYLEDGGFTTPTDFRVVIDVEYDDVYIETDDAGWFGLDRTPSNESTFLAEYINRPRKLKRVLEQQYSYDERRRWKEIIKYYRDWVKQPDSIVIK